MSQRLATPDTEADVTLRELLDSTPRRGFIVVAGAGSGKTTSLVKALAHVASTHGDELRARTQQVACITYTEIAASEIQDEVGNSEFVHVSTIHSFLWRVVRSFQADIAKWVEAKLRLKLLEAEEKQAGFTTRTRASTREAVARDIIRYRTQLDELPDVARYTYGLGSHYSRGILGHSDVLAMVPELIMNRSLLARLVGAQFPYVFVDESQDTVPSVVEALKCVKRSGEGGICVGFFGDPMQQIYPTGVGAIPSESDWLTIKKPENFRSSNSVLTVINRVRADADGLEQISGLPTELRREGEAWFFVLPADNDRSATLDRVRAWLTKHGSAGDWTADAPGGGAKILMILHQMAARRLGFHGLYLAFHPRGSGGALSDAFDAGTAWPLVPFKNVILPLSDAASDGGSLIATLRSHSRILSDASLAETSVAAALAPAREAIVRLREVVSAAGRGSIESALRLSFTSGLIDPDPRLAAYLDPCGDGTGTDLSEDVTRVVDSFMQCDIAELPGYFKYMENQSPYSTQHGTKGAEFPKVLVVLDDGESTWNMYSYEKLLGLRALSATDEDHRANGRDSVVERTRRLLYVCVSRATDALAVVLFTADVDGAVQALTKSGLLGGNAILTLDAI